MRMRSAPASPPKPNPSTTPAMMNGIGEMKSEPMTSAIAQRVSTMRSVVFGPLLSVMRPQKSPPTTAVVASATST